MLIMMMMMIMRDGSIEGPPGHESPNARVVATIPGV
jgi:hypothetical protein